QKILVFACNTHDEDWSFWIMGTNNERFLGGVHSKPIRLSGKNLRGLGKAVSVRVGFYNSHDLTAADALYYSIIRLNSGAAEKDRRGSYYFLLVPGRVVHRMPEILTGQD